nr:FadR/GntR family transcriptional regulator [Microbacterium esteraromaticum]
MNSVPLSPLLRDNDVVQPIQRRSLVDTVVDRLQSEIASGAWPVGSRIPTEAELVAALGVSRPSVREGVRALAQLGLLETRQGDGTYVMASDPTEVALRRALHDADPGEVFAVRRALDALAAVQAAENGDSEILALMEASLSARQDAADRGDGDAFVEHDVAFHLYVVKASGNALLGGIYASFVTSLRNSITQRRMGSMALAESPDDQHEALFQAIRAGDGQAARDAALNIIERSEQLPQS